MARWTPSIARRAAGVALIGLLYVLAVVAQGDGPAPLAVPVVGAQAACTPRPPIRTRVRTVSPDILSVTISAALPIQRIHFGVTQNAFLDVPGGPPGSPGGFDLVLTSSLTDVPFVVRRNGGVINVPLTVVDACGDWRTFVGAGLQARPATPTPSVSPTPTPTSSVFDPNNYVGQGDRFNCFDFESQAQTQAVLRADPNDPNRLDISSVRATYVPDGIACNSSLDAPEWSASFYFPQPYDLTPVPTPVGGRH
jgi:hypothetical protein